MTELQRHEKKRTAKERGDPSMEPSLLKELMFLFAKIAAIIFAFVLVFTLMFGLCRNPDASMDPAVRDGDLVMFYRLDKDYMAQDTLVLEFEGQKQVRRVIAVAGDTVDITEEGLLVNGALQQEKEICSATKRYEEGVEFPYIVGEGEVFVLGDRRDNASDSRIYGTVKNKDTLGKVMLILRWRNV